MWCSSLLTPMMFTWIAIGLCIVQTGIFSGLNLALFSVSRLRLEVEAASGNTDAAKLYALRTDSNYALTNDHLGECGNECGSDAAIGIGFGRAWRVPFFNRRNHFAR
jgi:Cyclin M transmembrane N-terminal domain